VNPEPWDFARVPKPGAPWTKVDAGAGCDANLPDEELDVLVCCDGDAYGDFQVAGWTCDDGLVRWINGAGEDVTGVTHWMDIPAVPK